MEHYLPEIFWHDRQALLSVDFQKNGNEIKGMYKIVTTSMQKEVRIWEFVFEKVMKQGERDALAVNFIANITGHQSAVNVARFSPSGEFLASADSSGAVFVWKLSPDPPAVSNVTDNAVDDFPPNKENWVRLRAPLRHESDVNCICWSGDNLYLASVSNDESVVVQNIRSGQRLWTLTGHRRFPNGVMWDPRGKYVLTMSTDRKLDILDAAKGTKLRCFHSVEFDEKKISEKIILNGVYKLFHDDQLISFTRCGDFSPDGELLIVPSAHLEVGDSNIYGTYIFRRRDLDKDRPAAFLLSKKPTFKAVCSPIIFKLRSDIEENMLGLPYRVVWAVLTLDTIIFYDSQCAIPFAYLDNIHYNSLSDAAWSADGKILLISSLEGYCSFVRFDLSLIGEITQFNLQNVPPSPVLIIPKKASKRSSKISLPVKSENGIDVLNDTAILDRTPSKNSAKNRPKTPCNPISKYFKKSPSRIHGAKENVSNLNDDVVLRKKETDCPSVETIAGSPKPKKQKRRVQLESVPLVNLD